MVLLVGINAKYIHTTLAVRSLQANAGKYRKDVEIAEYTINHRREEIFQDIYRRKQLKRIKLYRPPNVRPKI